MTELIANLTLGGLLLLTATWCALVHHRLRRLRTERGEMEAFIAALADASARAEAALAGLREAAEEQGEAARQRGAELARLIESGTRLARRLEADLGQGVRALASAGTPSSPERAGQRQARPVRGGEPALEPPSEPLAGRAVRSPKSEGGLSGELLRALETLR